MKNLIALVILGTSMMTSAQASLSEKAFRSIISTNDQCPAAYPLNCGNGKCCPSGSTLYCPQMEPTPCFDPNKLTDEQMKTLSDNCSPLLSCQ